MSKMKFGALVVFSGLLVGCIACDKSAGGDGDVIGGGEPMVVYDGNMLLSDPDNNLYPDTIIIPAAGINKEFMVANYGAMSVSQVGVDGKKIYKKDFENHKWWFGFSQDRNVVRLAVSPNESHNSRTFDILLSVSDEVGCPLSLKQEGKQ